MTGAAVRLVLFWRAVTIERTLTRACARWLARQLQLLRLVFMIINSNLDGGLRHRWRGAGVNLKVVIANFRQGQRRRARTPRVPTVVARLSVRVLSRRQPLHGA